MTVVCVDDLDVHDVRRAFPMRVFRTAIYSVIPAFLVYALFPHWAKTPKIVCQKSRKNT